MTPTAAEMPGSFSPDSRSLDRFLLALHRELSVDHVAWTSVNELRQMLGVDRVALLSGHRKLMRVRAISGLESVQRKSPVCQKMLAMARLVERTGEALIYEGGVQEISESLERALAEYVTVSNAVMVQVIPLFAQNPSTLDDSPDLRAPERRSIGCLVIEQFRQSLSPAGSRQILESLSEHVATALNAAHVHESILFQPFFRQVGLALTWLRGRRLAWAVFITALFALVMTIMVLVQIPYRFRADGHLMPSVRSSVFAPWDSDVVDIQVRDGDIVQKGDVLIHLVSDELQSETVVLENRIREKKKLVASLRTRLQEANSMGTRKDAIIAEGEFVREQLELNGAVSQLALLKKRIAELTVLAPQDGVVVSFDLIQKLARRPVNRGDLLLEVMNPQGPWRLELEVPDYRMGHVMQELLRSNDHSASLTYVLANDVRKTWTGNLNKIATRTNVSETSGAYVRAYCSVDERMENERRIGAEVNARITCGKCSILYSLVGDAWEFVQRKWL